eukprot:TRINITY_DN61651_c0_g1_i1.p1 TRINITY_DN61651_c0_g1~~TRINITY_DN61651_c0_g1_i1.p1  ORF type:complete len:635 (+),score=76.80 TRINITY_DN61651_c0_g1_i1:180-1907(+)
MPSGTSRADIGGSCVLSRTSPARRVGSGCGSGSGMCDSNALRTSTSAVAFQAVAGTAPGKSAGWAPQKANGAGTESFALVASCLSEQPRSSSWHLSVATGGCVARSAAAALPLSHSSSAVRSRRGAAKTDATASVSAGGMAAPTAAGSTMSPKMTARTSPASPQSLRQRVPVDRGDSSGKIGVASTAFGTPASQLVKRTGVARDTDVGHEIGLATTTPSRGAKKAMDGGGNRPQLMTAAMRRHTFPEARTTSGATPFSGASAKELRKGASLSTMDLRRMPLEGVLLASSESSPQRGWRTFIQVRLGGPERNVGLIRLIYEDARARHQGRSTFRIRRLLGRKRSVGPVLGEVCADVFAAVKRCTRAYKAVQLLWFGGQKRREARARVNIILKRVRPKVIAVDAWLRVLRRLRGPVGSDEAERMWRELCDSVDNLEDGPPASPLCSSRSIVETVLRSEPSLLHASAARASPRGLSLAGVAALSAATAAVTRAAAAGATPAAVAAAAAAAAIATARQHSMTLPEAFARQAVGGEIGDHGGGDVLSVADAKPAKTKGRPSLTRLSRPSLGGRQSQSGYG